MSEKNHAIYLALQDEQDRVVAQVAPRPVKEEVVWESGVRHPVVGPRAVAPGEVDGPRRANHVVGTDAGTECKTAFKTGIIDYLTNSV